MIAAPRAESKSWPFLFVLLGSCTGLLLGFCEAALLYSGLRIPALVKPEVGFLIWFLAPLVDLLAFTAIGLGLGVAGKVWRPPSGWKTAILVSMGLGAVGAFLISELFWFHVPIGGYWSLSRKIVTASIGFVVVMGVTLLVFKICWSRVGKVFDPRTQWPMRPLARTILMATGILAAGLFLCVAPVPTPAPSARVNSSRRGDRPNIVLISLDTVRADHLSSYGYFRPTTPNLDRLARQGVLFENAIAPSSWTLPSHVSILTGLLPHQHGVSSLAPLGEGWRTLAEIFRIRGYETAGFNANRYCGLAGWGLGQGFELYDDETHYLRHNLAATLLGETLLQRAYSALIGYHTFDRRDGGEVNQSVFSWFRRRSGRPFFVFINYFDAHHPYRAPRPYDKRFGKISEALLLKLVAIRYGKLSRPLSPEEQRSLIAGYDDSLAFLDHQVGELLRLLSSSSEWANTFVVVTADHGEAFGEHQTYIHGYNLYREVLHVPLIIVGPGIPPDLRISHVAGNRAIFSTILGLAGDHTAPLNRDSLSRFWTPGLETPTLNQAIVSELSAQPGEADVYPGSISTTTPEWHYIHDANGRSELYHWPNDPLEQTNLSAFRQYQDVVLNLQLQLHEIIQDSPRPWRGKDYLLALSRHFMSPGEAGEPSSQNQELLRSLPYH